MLVVSEASKQQQQAGSEMNVDMDDVIHEWGPNVYFMMLNSPSLRRRGDKHAKLQGFMKLKWKKIIHWPPFGSFSRGKMAQSDIYGRCTFVELGVKLNFWG